MNSTPDVPDLLAALEQALRDLSVLVGKVRELVLHEQSMLDQSPVSNKTIH